jgi:hypothetical protein
LIMKDILWKNNSNFMNDVCTISVYFIINAIVVSEKKKQRHYFSTAPLLRIV